MHVVLDAGSSRAHALVEHLKRALPSGSALVMTHATPDYAPEAMSAIVAIYTRAGTPLQFRTKDEFARFFDGWDLLEPGVVPSHHWRPVDPVDADQVAGAEAACYAAVARKP